ncbi:MAG: FAD-binding oxidoreductase [Rhodobacteraceae bacterium]|nr:FAD-binding oxidoreductase [Paracoccaceae bacterium]
MTKAVSDFDIAVIGGGMAGASVAAELAGQARVVLLEMEAQPGYHTTGRSAALFAPSYGPGPIRALTRASEAFFHAPPDGFCTNRLITPRGILMVARADQLAALDALIAEVSAKSPVSRLDQAGVMALNPLLREGYAAAGMFDANGQDIDVAALHQGYLRRLRGTGGEVRTKAEVTGLSRQGDFWRIATADSDIRARIVVNAAGAWADQIGQLAGAERIGLVPKRRTAMMVAAPDGQGIDTLPITVDIDEAFYLKPDAGRLLLSPADETPSPPCDAQPEEMDIAICVDRVETAFQLSVRRIENKWAGLRSFVADKSPVAGYSGQVDGFFWLAGQGGYGIQTAPALSRFAAAQILGAAVPQDILDQGLDPVALSPARLGQTGQTA